MNLKEATGKLKVGDSVIVKVEKWEGEEKNTEITGVVKWIQDFKGSEAVVIHHSHPDKDFNNSNYGHMKSKGKWKGSCMFSVHKVKSEKASIVSITSLDQKDMQFVLASEIARLLGKEV
jgi:hypothetical protein